MSHHFRCEIGTTPSPTLHIPIIAPSEVPPHTQAKTWLITIDNHRYLNPHIAVLPHPDDSTRGQLDAHPGLATQIGADDILLLDDRMSPRLILSYLLSGDIATPHCYMINTSSLTEKTPDIDATNIIEDYFLSKDHGVEATLIQYSPIDTLAFCIEEKNLLAQLQDPKRVLRFWGLGKTHPLYNTLLIASQFGHILTADRRIEVHAQIQLMPHVNRVSVVGQPNVQRTLSSVDPATPEQLSILLDQHPGIVLMGNPGTGKSWMIPQLQSLGVITPFYGMPSIGDFIRSTDPRAALVVDEFNLLSNDDTNTLNGFFQPNPLLFHDGKNHAIGTKKLILIGNFSTQVGRTKTTIENNLPLVIFAPIDSDVLIEKSLDQHPGAAHTRDGIKPTLVSFVELCRQHIPKYPISFRDIHNILDLYLRKNVSLAQICHDELRYFFEKAGAYGVLNLWREWEGPASSEDPTIRDCVSSAVTDFLKDRASLSTGKTILLLEGSPGIGKSYTAEMVFVALGMGLTHADPHMRYIKLTLASADIGSVLSQLRDAISSGSIVLIDEFNTNPNLAEKILTEINSAESQHTTRPFDPHFRLIATQNNAAHFGLLQRIPESILSRTRCIALPDIRAIDLYNIMADMPECEGMDPEIMRQWITDFLTARETIPDLTPQDFSNTVKAMVNQIWINSFSVFLDEPLTSQG